VDIHDPTCPFYKNKEEDAAHLFYSCSKIMPLWWESLSRTNTSAPFPENPHMHFLQHVVGNGNGNSFQKWKCWWISLIWSIWQHRNKIVFEEERFNDNKLLEDAIFLCWTWLKNLVKGFGMPFYHWSSNMKEAFMGWGGTIILVGVTVRLAYRQYYGFLIHVVNYVLGHHSPT